METRRRFLAGAIGAAVSVAVPPRHAAASEPRLRPIPLTEVRDRIEGGWAGQMIGQGFGQPFQWKSLGKLIVGELPPWTPERVAASLEQDGLYVDMTLAQVLDDKGLDATTDDFGAALRAARYRTWHGNLAARRALLRGVPARLAGTPRYNVHASDLDFQIEADFIGLMCPGMPRTSNRFCERVGRVMSYGDGLYGGMFVAGMYTAAWFEQDPRKVVEAGLACIPRRSRFGRAISDVLDGSRQHPRDWTQVWRLLQERWDGRDPCPRGALQPFNCDAVLNGAYIAMGLLYGSGDFARTMEVATRCGQDSGCNTSNAAGVLGAMLGYRRIPDLWKSGLPAIAHSNFSQTGYSFRKIVDSTERRTLALVRRNGGRIEDGTLFVRTESPKAPALAVWDDFGTPAEAVEANDPRWQWTGAWRPAARARSARVKGAEASIRFEGTGVIVQGPYMATGGKADVYLDGRFQNTVDVYHEEVQPKGNEAVWSRFDLKRGPHDLRLVVRGEPFGASKDTEVAITQLIVFRKPAP